MGLGGILGGRDMALSLLMMPFQLWQEEQARKANEKRYGQLVKGALGAVGVDSGTAPEDVARAAGGDVTALEKQNADTIAANAASAQKQLGEYDTMAGDLRGKYGERRARIMSYLDKFGNQELADTERIGNEEAAASDMALRNAGLAGTSIATSARRGNLRERADQLGRVNERLAATRMNADQALSGEELGVDAQLQQGRAALSGSLADREVGLRDDLGSRRFDFANRTLDRVYNTIEGRTDAYPDQGIYLGLQQGLGQSAGYKQYLDSVKGNWATSTFGPAAGVAAGTAAGVGTAGLLGSLGSVGGAAAFAPFMLSDRRAKTDIRNVAKIGGMPIKKFRYKGSPRTHVGVIAQDVEKKYPELVETGRDGLKRVNYRGLRRRLAG